MLPLFSRGLALGVGVHMYPQEFKIAQNKIGVWLISTEKTFAKRVLVAHAVPGRAGKLGSLTMQPHPQSGHRTGEASRLWPPPLPPPAMPQSARLLSPAALEVNLAANAATSLSHWLLI